MTLLAVRRPAQDLVVVCCGSWSVTRAKRRSVCPSTTTKMPSLSSLNSWHRPSPIKAASHASNVAPFGLHFASVR